MVEIKEMLEKRYKILVCLFFAMYLFIGISIFKDYGISWDEKTQRITGIISFQYVVKGDKELLAYHDRYFGPVFEIPLVAVEKIFKLTKDRDIFLMRHL